MILFKKNAISSFEFCSIITGIQLYIVSPSAQKKICPVIFIIINRYLINFKTCMSIQNSHNFLIDLLKTDVGLSRIVNAC